MNILPLLVTRTRRLRLAMVAVLLSVSAALPGAVSAEPNVMPYPNASDLAPSPDYAVQADGHEIFTQKSPVASFASFALNGSADVVVKVNRPIKRAVVRPLSLGIQPVVADNTLRFKLTRPCKIAVEVGGDLRRPLFLFADAPETNSPIADTPNVRYFEGGKIHEVGTLELIENVRFTDLRVEEGC